MLVFFVANTYLSVVDVVQGRAICFAAAECADTATAARVDAP